MPTRTEGKTTNVLFKKSKNLLSDFDLKISKNDKHNAMLYQEFIPFEISVVDSVMC